jgi:hypothetical protein
MTEVAAALLLWKLTEVVTMAPVWALMEVLAA